LVPSLPPFALVDNLGREQKRLERRQSLADVKRGVCRSFTASEYIRQIFSPPALRDDAWAAIAAPAPALVDLAFRKGALESLDDFDGDRTLIENVRSDLALFLRRRHGLFPLNLPRGLSFRRETRGAAQQKSTKANCQPHGLPSLHARAARHDQESRVSRFGPLKTPCSPRESDESSHRACDRECHRLGPRRSAPPGSDRAAICGIK